MCSRRRASSSMLADVPIELTFDLERCGDIDALIGGSALRFRALLFAFADQHIEAHNAILVADGLHCVFRVDVVFELNNLLR